MAEPNISFGPPNQQWQYSKEDNSFDLSHDAARTLQFKTILGAEVQQPGTLGSGNAQLVIDPVKTALVVVDMQNFFLHPTCRAHPRGLDAVQPTARMIEKCREVGIQVIWLNWGLTDTDMATMPAAFLRGSMSKEGTGGLGVDLGAGRGKTLFAESWNAEIYPELKRLVEETDLHCAKNRMSGLWSPEQPLFKTLRERKISTLLFAGVNTDQCVLGTLVDAHNHGWASVVVEDACATTTVSGREVTLYNVAAYYGFVTDSSTFCAGTINSK